ncbi:TraX family protein [Lagierella sp.]|uniref:TraX family protein n=1 Tax=Lagierella sp. TaxID=2849657 RepID=UPI0026340D31|nr:TraX family protein [Lagierella sp.]
MNSEVIENYSHNKRGLTIDALKYIAIVAMLIDHIATAFVTDYGTVYYIMRLIGRITGPVMFFSAVEGYHHTRNLKKYIIRLALFALISYLPYMYAFNDDFDPWRLNVIFTILFGIIAIYVRRNVENPVLKFFMIFLIFIVSIPADYGTSGLLMILVMDYYYGNRDGEIFGYLIVILLQYRIFDIFITPLWTYMKDGVLDTTYIKTGCYLLGYFVPIFLFKHYNGRKGNTNNKFLKWSFYIFYPLHLAIIALIRIYIVK